MAGLHLLHGLSEGASAVFYGITLPLVVSLLIIGGGYWIAWRDWPLVPPWYVVGWYGGGLAAGVGVVALLVQYQAAEGVSLAHSFFVYVMFGTYGSAVGLLVGWYDSRRREEYVRQKRETQRLDEFASIVSHDLRNPLTVAMGRLELVQEEFESEHLDVIARAHGRIEALIEDVLTLAREGESVIETETVDLGEVVERSWRNVETSRATVVIETDRVVRADPDRCQQLLENLIRNAVEHGGEDVAVTVGDVDGGFYVADDGEGIPERKRERVFERGYSTSEDGTGFGLAIVGKIAEAHGWDVDVTGSDEGGARFEVTGIVAENERRARPVEHP